MVTLEHGLAGVQRLRDGRLLYLFGSEGLADDWLGARGCGHPFRDLSIWQRMAVEALPFAAWARLLFEAEDRPIAKPPAPKLPGLPPALRSGIELLPCGSEGAVVMGTRALGCWIVRPAGKPGPILTAWARKIGAEAALYRAGWEPEEEKGPRWIKASKAPIWVSRCAYLLDLHEDGARSGSVLEGELPWPFYTSVEAYEVSQARAPAPAAPLEAPEREKGIGLLEGEAMRGGEDEDELVDELLDDA